MIPEEQGTRIARRTSVRTRLRTEDVSSWVTHNRPVYPPENQQQEQRVQFLESENDDAVSTNSTLTEVPRHLDGGYGWYIIIYSFFFHFVIDGSSFSFGVIFPKIQEHFGTQRTGASGVASLFLAFPLIFAPIAGAVCDILDCRLTLIIGSTICTVSTFLSLLCTDMVPFTILFGACNGLGMSFIYNAAIVIVTYYFDVKRGIATSIAVAGTGFGTLCFPFYIRLVTNCFPFKGELVPAVSAVGIAFACCLVLAFCLKDVEWTSDTTEWKKKKFERKVKKMLSEAECPLEPQEMQSLRRSNSLPSMLTGMFERPRYENTSVQSIRDALEGKTDYPARSKSVGTFMQKRRAVLPTVPEYTMLSPVDIDNLQHLDLHMQNSPSATIHSRRTRRRMLSDTNKSMSVDRINDLEGEDIKINFTTSSSVASLTSEGMASSTSNSEMSNDGDSSSSELTDNVTKKELELNATNGTTLVKKVPNSARDGVTIFSTPNSARYNRTSLAPGMTGMSAGRVMAGNALQPRRMIQTNLLGIQGKMLSAPSLSTRKKRRNMFARIGIVQIKNTIIDEVDNYSTLLNSVPFRWFLFGVSCLYSVLDLPYIFINDYATENLNIPAQQADLLTSSVGAANLISTILFGISADRSYIKPHLFSVYAVALAIVAACMVGFSYVKTFAELMTVSAVFGASISSNYVLQSILLCGIFEGSMSMFQSAYSFTSFCQGVSSLLGPIVIGYIRDQTGTYTAVFFFAGILVMLSAFSTFMCNRFRGHDLSSSNTSRRSSTAGGRELEKIAGDENFIELDRSNLLVAAI